MIEDKRITQIRVRVFAHPNLHNSLNVSRLAPRGLIRFILQQIPWLAVQGLAEGIHGG